jgi:radical SAM superfamily enzyme YgiQ (UPF0313 family)
MKILFVRPRPSPETIGLQHLMIVEPLELEVLASLLDSDDTPVIVDMILEKKPVEFFINKEKPGVFCVTGYITNVPAMIDYCRIAKSINPSTITLVGGVHCEVCPDDLNSEFIDFRVVRNANISFPELMAHIKYRTKFPEGVLRTGQEYDPSTMPAFNFYFPPVDRSHTKQYREKYFYIFHDKVALVKTSFGCPFECNFCFCREITKGAYQVRPLEEVVDELKSIREKNIYIVDDDFLTGRKKVEQFIRVNEEEKLDKHYLLYGRADFIAQNPDLMKRFFDVGLRTVIVGFESFRDDELDRYNKNTRAATNETAMKVLNETGIECYATLIVSSDWGKEDFAFHKNKIKNLGIHYVNLQPLTPLPGTGQRVDKEKLVIPFSEYEKWDLAHVTIRPEKMTVPEFYKNILGLYHAILFQPKHLLRYIRKSNPKMLYKMMVGSYLVSRQYYKKIKEATLHA